MIRPNYLVHWTGKDIASDPELLTDGDRRKYLDRLTDILHNGFWMTRPPEKLMGRHPRSPKGGSVSFTYEANMTCFTEIRLSQSVGHAKLYGCLGIGVDREYILERWGSPVHYVRNHEREKIVSAFFDLRYMLVKLKQAGVADAELADGYLSYIGTFLKGMSQFGKDEMCIRDRLKGRRSRLLRNNRRPRYTGLPQAREPTSSR